MKILHGNCLDKLKELEDNSIDSIVTDPPYELGFMGKSWDSTGIANNVELWKECLRVLKPGGHLLAFSGTRTYHRMASAIEDAGFEVRDMIEWVYGSGFPKSRNIGKDVEKINVGGLKNLKQIGTKQGIKCETGTKGYSYSKEYVAGKCMGGKQISGKIPVYEINNEWEGWGTALKPAHEPICLARKPLEEKTVAENVLKYGTGGINIDESRVEAQKGDKFEGTGFRDDTAIGRFPANLIHDNSEEVRECFPNESDRFFKSIIYQAKASKSERNKGCEELEEKKTKGSIGLNTVGGTPTNYTECRINKNHHPTVKPIALMEYLIKMVTPKGGIVLDPFMGSGSTGCAAKKNGYDFVGIEMEDEYIKIAEARINSY